MVHKGVWWNLILLIFRKKDFVSPRLFIYRRCITGARYDFKNSRNGRKEARELNDEALKSKSTMNRRLLLLSKLSSKTILNEQESVYKSTRSRNEMLPKRNSLKLVRLTPKSKKSLMTSTAQIVTAGLTKSSRE